LRSLTAIDAGPLAEFPGCQVIAAAHEAMRILRAIRIVVANATTGLRFDRWSEFSDFRLARRWTETRRGFPTICCTPRFFGGIDKLFCRPQVELLILRAGDFSFVDHSVIQNGTDEFSRSGRFHQPPVRLFLNDRDRGFMHAAVYRGGDHSLSIFCNLKHQLSYNQTCMR